jgi:hypothetical protein
MLADPETRIGVQRTIVLNHEISADPETRIGLDLKWRPYVLYLQKGDFEGCV